MVKLAIELYWSSEHHCYPSSDIWNFRLTFGSTPRFVNKYFETHFKTRFGNPQWKETRWTIFWQIKKSSFLLLNSILPLNFQCAQIPPKDESLFVTAEVFKPGFVHHVTRVVYTLVHQTINWPNSSVPNSSPPLCVTVSEWKMEQCFEFNELRKKWNIELDPKKWDKMSSSLRAPTLLQLRVDRTADKSLSK